MRVSVLAAFAAGLLLSKAPARAQQPIVIKVSHVVTPDTPKGKGAEKFKELAEKYTNGRAKIEIYPNSQLYKDKEEVEALQLGAVQMLAPSLAKFGPLGAKEFEVFDIPYILPDKAALRRVTDGALGKKLYSKLEPKGIRGLAYWDNGFKVMSANKPLRMPDDFRGLKMRIQSSKVLEAQMRALGAIPQVLAFSEVYQALQTGVVDGTENPHSNLYTQKMNEVQKNVTITDHGYIGYAVVANKKFWDGLPADIHRYLSGMPIPGVQDWLLTLNFSWAQEATIYLFVWMAKFGAAYGVRTGIHVGVDIFINRMKDRTRAKFVLFGLLAGALFTGTIAIVGARFVWDHGAHHALY